MTPQQHQRYRARMELISSFIPHNPMEARNQARHLLRELEALPEADAPEGRALRATVASMYEEYRHAAEAWLEENVRRGARHLARERAAMEPGVDAGEPRGA